MRVKICGLTRREDVELCDELGATHVGFVIEPKTPRCVALERVAELVEKVTAVPVLVLRKANTEMIVEATRRTGVRSVQLHCTDDRQVAELESEGLSLHRVRAVSQADRDLSTLNPTPDRKHLWQLDVGGGGTGSAFDWSLLGERSPSYVFIAGGITPENLPVLLERAPWGIDLSSGVECSPGIKDQGRLRALFQTVRCSV